MRLITDHPLLSPIAACIIRAAMSKNVSVYLSDPVMSTLVLLWSYVDFEKKKRSLQIGTSKFKIQFWIKGA